MVTHNIMKFSIAIISAALVLIFARPSNTAVASPRCSEAEQRLLPRLVDDHREKMAQAEAAVDRQRAINAEEALASGHVGWVNTQKLLHFERELAQWRHVADGDIARYEACFGYPPPSLYGRGTSRQGFATPKPRVQSKWAGDYSRGSYKVKILGGSGSLSYTFDREDGVGTCCPTIDKGGGECKVVDNVATCDLTADYSDSDKKVHYEGKGTLTYSRLAVDYKFLLTGGSITLTTGTCPDIKQCTGLHPGTVLEGTWSREKP